METGLKTEVEWGRRDNTGPGTQMESRAWDSDGIQDLGFRWDQGPGNQLEQVTQGGNWDLGLKQTLDLRLSL